MEYPLTPFGGNSKHEIPNKKKKQISPGLREISPKSREFSRKPREISPKPREFSPTPGTIVSTLVAASTTFVPPGRAFVPHDKTPVPNARKCLKTIAIANFQPFFFVTLRVPSWLKHRRGVKIMAAGLLKRGRGQSKKTLPGRNRLYSNGSRIGYPRYSPVHRGGRFYGIFMAGRTIRTFLTVPVFLSFPEFVI
jgi:hypothetical protein